jgi:putative FmdB family regulatory protein
MPIYEYECPKCGTMEIMQKISAKPLKKCPTCSCKVRKLVSQTSFQLKGTGWYVTDYANKGKGRGKEKTESSSSSSASPSSTTPEKTAKAEPASIPPKTN